MSADWHDAHTESAAELSENQKPQIHQLVRSNKRVRDRIWEYCAACPRPQCDEWYDFAHSITEGGSKKGTDKDKEGAITLQLREEMVSTVDTLDWQTYRCPPIVPLTLGPRGRY